jgi:hypothetical protein
VLRFEKKQLGERLFLSVGSQLDDVLRTIMDHSCSAEEPLVRALKLSRWADEVKQIKRELVASR